LWVGKTRHTVKHLKSNIIKTVDLKCAISKPGIYNLNRFKIVINDKDDEYDVYSNFLTEVKLTDDILLHVK